MLGDKADALAARFDEATATVAVPALEWQLPSAAP